MNKFELEEPAQPDLRMSNAISTAVWAVPIVVLLLGLLPLPIGYYTFVRIVTCISAAYLAWKEYEFGNGKMSNSTWILGAIAILFNPIVPIYLTREIWLFLDVGAALVIGAHWSLTRSPLWLDDFIEHYFYSPHNTK